ncbi:MAG: hypothetical protein HY741_01325 [Chloroflexi bacterium]|nr:hypothetical protein [Chloroflexota bacterium]
MAQSKSNKKLRQARERAQTYHQEYPFRTTLDLNRISIDKTWTFSDLTQKQTRYISHGYYTYPAKFIPQLARRLICELTAESDTVVDPFMGSGTTIVEAMISGRKGVGTDVNPVAHLVAKVKSTPINPELLRKVYGQLVVDLEHYLAQRPNLFARYHPPIIPENERIDYWFRPSEKERLGIIFGRITVIEEPDCRDFFLVAFSQSLKSSSIWMQKSIKPTRDRAKVPVDPLAAFLRQSRFMLKQNEKFWNLVPPSVRSNLDEYRVVTQSDARVLPVSTGDASLVVTSPPYVTSYEYADLHQLTALWLGYTNSVNQFRHSFIGSAYSNRSTIDLRSDIANAIVENLETEKKRREVRNYFADMLECFREMYRVLRVGGKACIVIGNTKFEGVEIANAQVFIEQMMSLGFVVHKIIKREIPSKILPQTRDPENGQFTSSANAEKVLAYPVEFILIMEKQHGIR